MQKNVKGFIGLIAGILAFVLIVIAWIPTTEIRNSGINFYGPNSSTFALIGAALGVVAIVFGILSKKDKDKTGPRKAGVIIGIIAIIIALISAGATMLLATVTQYANNPKDPMFDSLTDQQRADFDKAIDQMLEAASKQ